MSLLTTATAWNIDDQPTQKKRIPQIRKTVKQKPLALQQPYSESSIMQSEPEAFSPSKDAVTYDAQTAEDAQKMMEERNKRIHELINHATSVSGKDAGAGLANFRPPPLAMATQEKKMGEIEGFAPVMLQRPEMPEIHNELQHEMPKMPKPMIDARFSPNTEAYGGANYRNIYSTAQNMKTSSHNMDEKTTEKINYMIHLLEELKVEKTDNVMEEFVMFSMLGVFVIFVLDSFSKTAKYIR